MYKTWLMSRGEVEVAPLYLVTSKIVFIIVFIFGVGATFNGCTHRVMILYDGAVDRHRK